MCSALYCIYIIHVSKYILRIGIIVLHRDFYINRISFFLKNNRSLVYCFPVLVQVFYKCRQTAYIFIITLFTGYFVFDGYSQSFIKKSKFHQSLREDFKVKLNTFKYLGVCKKINSCASSFGFPDDFEFRTFFSPFITLPVYFSIPADFRRHPFRKCINYRYAYAVQSARYLV